MLTGCVRKLPMPTLYDISDSAHWANKADMGIIVHRSEDKHGNSITTIKVAKSRYHDQIGIPGVVDVVFDPDSNRFTATDSEDSRAA